MGRQAEETWLLADGWRKICSFFHWLVRTDRSELSSVSWISLREIAPCFLQQWTLSSVKRKIPERLPKLNPTRRILRHSFYSLTCDVVCARIKTLPRVWFISAVYLQCQWVICLGFQIQMKQHLNTNREIRRIAVWEFLLDIPVFFVSCSITVDREAESSLGNL
jgi:hypothetical protein